MRLGMGIGALLLLLGALGGWSSAGLAQGIDQGIDQGQNQRLAQAEPSNDFPTAARADYVFACMATNGQSQDALNRCSCSIDVIASLLSYERYVQAETVVRMQQVGGEKTAMFRDSVSSKQILDDLRRAQAEAEIRCF